jgi:ATP-dependent DNA helicase DinG
MFTGLLQKFPEPFTPNKSQVKLIQNIEKAFDDGYKFVVCSAPTGSGKSFISKTLGNNSKEPSDVFQELVTSYQIYKHNNLGGYQNADEANDEKPFGAFALTITKALQDQYKELFDDVDVLKGKSNYQCNYDNNFTVEQGPCVHIKAIKEDCWKCNGCSYYKARNKALISKFATLNYNMFFALPDHVKRKQYLICDEASELEDQLVKEFSCQINFDFLKKSMVIIRPFPSDTDYGKVGKWVNTLCQDIEEQVEDLRDIIANKTGKIPSASINEKRNEVIQLLNLHSKLRAIVETWHDSEYLFERTVKGINFMPLKVDQLSKYLFNYADKVILMSATIIDPSNFCKTLGIDKFKYIEAESTFDPKKAPIYANTKIKLNYNNMQANLPKIADQVRQICEHHANDKGLIHTQTNTITKYLQDNVKCSRILYREPGVRNEELLDIHYNSDKPTIMASPSMSHGVDLKDDLARFQIIIKAPYLPTNDKRVERMMKLDFNWYTNKMLSSLIQACGRGVRSNKDHCVTYILDAAIVENIVKHKHKIPKYFLDRFV